MRPPTLTAGRGVDEGQEAPVDLEQRRDTVQESVALSYDSAERRRQFASSLEAKGIGQKTTAARLRADGENAKHPREAVSGEVGNVTRVQSKANSAVNHRDRRGRFRRVTWSSVVRGFVLGASIGTAGA